MIARGISLLRGPLGVLAGITFVSSLGIAIMLPLIPLYALSLGAEPWQLGLLTASFSVASALAQLATGFAIDRVGSLPFIRFGIGTYAGANILIGTAAGAAQLIGYRFLAGLGGGANLVSTRVYVAQVSDPSRLAFTQSILSAANSAGSVLGPALGGIVAAAASLHLPFFIVGGTSLIALMGALALRPASTRQPIGGGAVGPAFTRTVLTLLVANLLLLVAFGGFITTYAPYATTRLGWSTLEVGLIFSLFGIGDLTLGPWLGHLADRTGRRRMAALAVVPIALFGITVVLGLPRPILWFVSFVTGGALTAFNGSWFALLSAAVHPARRGRVFGVVSAVANTGTVIGALGAALVWQVFDIAGGLVIASAASLLAGAAMLMVPADDGRRE